MLRLIKHCKLSFYHIKNHLLRMTALRMAEENGQYLSGHPLVVVIGATGTGKTKLAIEISKKFNGEVVSADSMQLYKSLDIITNKVKPEECRDVPHHMISFLDPDVNFTVVEFRNKALPLIDSLIEKSKLPVITGGTNYYIESILWKVLVSQSHPLKRNHLNDKSSEAKKPKFDSESLGETNWFKLPLEEDQTKHLSNIELHDKLKEVDIESASILHPNNRRKVVRALQVYLQEQIPLSELITSQRSCEGGSSLGGPLRYPQAIMLWLQCDKDILNTRLDERVDSMIEDGLIKELLDFQRLYSEHQKIKNEKADYTKGIFQSIGFKEFHNFLMLTPEQRSSPEGEALFKKGVEDLKLVTRRYARTQIKWINNRFLRDTGRLVPEIYALNASDISKWDSTVRDPAFEIIDSYMKGTRSPHEPLTRTAMRDDVQKLFHCPECDRLLVSQSQWEIHLKSKKHHKRLQALKKLNSISTA